MNAPHFRGKRRTISASSLVNIIGADLGQIRHEDGLTWGDIGRVLGKSEDQAAKYADGSAEMPVTVYLFARREWGTRITARVQALVDGDRARLADSEILPDILGCAKGISEALGDGRIDARDLHECRKEIEEAIAALYTLVSKMDEVPA